MNKTYELCPICEEEVQLEAIFKVQICPACGEPILPCSLCSGCTYDCPLDKELENAMKQKSMTYNEFEQRLYNCDTILGIVQICIEHPDLAKQYIERQELLK